MFTLRSLTAAAAACALALASCGGTARHAAPRQPLPATASRCQPSNWAMQCGPRTFGAAPRAIPGIGGDFAWATVPASQARALGWKFAISYLSFDATKDWTTKQLTAYRAAGIPTGLVWETTAARCLAGYSAGRADANSAQIKALYLGIPSSRPIYFACDTDTTGQAASIDGYYRGVDSYMSAVHRPVGAYGGNDTIAWVHDHREASYFWETAAWRYGRPWLPYAQLLQYAFPTPAYDLDQATAIDFGQWPQPPKPKPPTPKPNRHYERFIDSTYPFQHGRLLLNERATVQAFDKHPTSTLEADLLLLRNRIWAVVHFNAQPWGCGPIDFPTSCPGWKLYWRGWRWQQLEQRIKTKP